MEKLVSMVVLMTFGLGQCQFFSQERSLGENVMNFERVKRFGLSAQCVAYVSATS